MSLLLILVDVVYLCNISSFAGCFFDCLFAYLTDCVWLSVYLSVWMTSCLTVWLSDWLFDCLSLWLSVCLCDYLSVCVTVCLSVCLSVKRFFRSIVVHDHKLSITSTYSFIHINVLFSELLKTNGRFIKKGDPIKRTKYGKTLQKIAEAGADEFYSGEMAKQV